MDINEEVPLPKKLTTPLPELPKMIPPAPGDQGTALPKKPEGVSVSGIDSGVPLPEKLTTPVPERLEGYSLGGLGPIPEKSEAERRFESQFSREFEKQPRQFDGASNERFAPTVETRISVAGGQNKPDLSPRAIERPVSESARLAGGGFDLLKIKKDAEQKAFSGVQAPALDLPAKLIRAHGNREEKVFEPAGSSIPTFVARDNTNIKLSEKLAGPKAGVLLVAKQCGVQFEAPQMGQPMMRQVKIVWPKPMEKGYAKPAAPFKGVGAASRDLQGLKPDPAASFPGQTLPTGAQQVQVHVTGPKLGVPSPAAPMPRRPEPKFMGLQDPPRLGPSAPEAEGRPSVDEVASAARQRLAEIQSRIQAPDFVEKPEIDSQIKKMVEDSLEAARARMSAIQKKVIEAETAPEAKSEETAQMAQVDDLKTENEALREAVKTLGGKVALYEAEIQILKAKRG